MKKVFLIHGFNGEPNGGWRPWLMGELAKNEIWACALAMPTPDAPKKDEWVAEIARMVGEPNEETFLVGHSLGSPAVLRYLEGLPAGKKIGGAVLVSGFANILEGDKYHPIANFVDTPFNFEHINSVCKTFAVIHGDNDPAVPFENAELLSKKFSCPLISIPNGGHLNGSAGWYSLPEVLDALLKMMD